MRRLALASGLLIALAGCVPSVSPLYRDFALHAASGVTSAQSGNGETALVQDETSLVDRAARALQHADWTLDAVPDSATVLRTEARTVSNIGLYRTDVTLEVIPLSGSFVRVQIHPYRHYLIGGRSKLPYLRPGLRRAILPSLETAFEAEGLQMLGTARKRDRADT